MRKNTVFCSYVIGTTILVWLVAAVIQFFQVYVFCFIKLILWQLMILATCPQSTAEWLKYLRFLFIFIVLIPIIYLVLLQYACFSG